MKSLLTALFAAALVSAASLAAQETETAAPVRLQIDVDRAVLPADAAQRAIVKISLDAVRLPRRHERAPLNLALVIDRSGSMQGDKIERAREAALELVRQLSPDDLVSLVAYDSAVEVLVPAGPVRDGRALAAAIRRLEPRGYTALHGGVSAGAAEVRRHLGESKHVPRVLLLSDGQANRGPSAPEELGRLGAALRREGISVSTIGLGLGFNEDLMAALAARSDGNTYFVEHSDDLPRIFAAELGDAFNVVARRVVVEIEFPAGVRPLRFVGREGVIRADRAELTLNQLYGGQEKFALIEVEVAASGAGAELEIARAQLRYEDARSARPHEARAARKVSFSPEAKVVVASANHRVQADYAQNALAEAKEEAITLVDSGRREDAGKIMRERADEIATLAKDYGNPQLDAYSVDAAAAAASVAREGLSNAARKTLRAEAQQVRTQQGNASGSRR